MWERTLSGPPWGVWGVAVLARAFTSRGYHFKVGDGGVSENDVHVYLTAARVRTRARTQDLKDLENEFLQIHQRLRAGGATAAAKVIAELLPASETRA